MALKVGELEADITLDDSPFDRGLKSSEGKFRGFAKQLATETDKAGRTAGSKLAGVAKSTGAGIAGMVKFAGMGVAGVGLALASAAPMLMGTAANLELLGKKAKTVFGSELGKVDDWAKTNAHAMGLTSREATGLAAGFADLLIPMGFTRKAAADMATKTVGLSGALAEWSGGTKSATEVTDILSAAFMGERDGLNALGISITQAEVDAALLAKGQEDLTGKALQQAEALATQNLIMEKSGDAQKAFAEGAGSLARKNKENTARLKEMGQTLLVTATPAMLGIGTAIGKHVLPVMERFVGWVSGPGKYVLISWALDAASAFLGFADGMLGGLQSVLGGLGKYARVALIAAAASVALFNPSMAANMLTQADAVGTWATEAAEGIGGARDALKGWKEGVDNTNTKVKIQADIADLDAKLIKANKDLKDPNLTKTRKAELTAEIAKLTRAKDEALRKLGDPKLIQTRTAKLEADKRALDTKIAAAKTALKDPKLTATKTAALKADIRQLIRQKAAAQAAIDALHGKTITITARAIAIVSKQYEAVTSGRLDYFGKPAGKALGGPVKKGTPYIVGEHRPELFVPDQDGNIVPKVPAPGSGTPYGGGTQTVEVVIRVEAGGRGDRLMDAIVSGLRTSVKSQGGNVQTVLGQGR